MWQQEYLFFPWFWLRCTKQSQCSTIAVPSSVLLRAVGLPSPHPASYRCRKEEGGFGKRCCWDDWTCTLSFHFFTDCSAPFLHFDKTKIADKTDYRTEKLKSTYCTHMEAHPLFLQIMGTAPLPPQISGLPKLPPFPRTPSEVAIMRKAMKSWELKKKLRKVN